MISPSIYIYVIFFVLLFYLIKQGYWKNVFRSAARHLSGNYGLCLFSVMAIIITVIFIDQPVDRFFSHFEYPLIEPVIKFGNSFGKGEIHFSILLVLILVFMIFRKKKLRIIFSISLMTSIFSGITVDILKAVFTRARPVIANSSYNFFVFREAYRQGQLFHYEYLSMPSGHTITVVAAVVPLFLYFKNRYIRTGLVILASIPAVARLYINVHWASDVLAGVLLGIFLGKIIYNNNKNRLEIKDI